LPYTSRPTARASEDTARTMAVLGRLADQSQLLIDSSHKTMVAYRAFISGVTEKLAVQAEERAALL
jgi:hypothetical protein